MNVRAVRTYEEFLSLEPVWNGLLSQSDVDSPFMTFEVVRLWWQLYGGQNDLLFLVAEEGGRARAIAPLKLKRIFKRGMPVRAVQFATDYFAVRTGMIIAPGAESAVGAFIRWLKAEGPGFDILLLDLVGKDSRTAAGLDGCIAGSGVKARKLEAAASPYIKIGSDWGVFERGLSRNLREKIKRMKSGFDREGGCEIAVYRREGIGAAMDDVLAVSRNTWKYRAGTAIANDKNERIRFHRELVSLAAEKGWLELWILRLRGAPLAFAMNFLYGGTMYFAQTGYHEAFGRLSPGLYLLVETMKDAFSRGCSEYDMMGKDEPYKLRFAPSVRECVKYYVFNVTARGSLLSFIECAAVPALKGA